MRDREGWTDPEKKIGDRIEKEGWKLRGQLDIDHHPTHHIISWVLWVGLFVQVKGA